MKESIELRPAVGLGGFFEPGDRQHFVAALVFVADQKLKIHDAHRHCLRIVAAVFVLDSVDS